MELFKKVTKSGGITIPQIMRHQLNIPKGSAVKLEATDEGIMIKKHVPTCMVCGTADHIKKLGDVELCKVHLEEMLKMEEGVVHE